MFKNVKKSFLGYCRDKYAQTLVEQGKLIPLDNPLKSNDGLDDVVLADINKCVTEANVNGWNEQSGLLARAGQWLNAHPRVKKGLALGTALTLAVASSGCAEGTNDFGGKIRDFHYDSGPDGVNETADDFIIVDAWESRSGGEYSKKEHHEFQIGTDANQNLSYLMTQLEKDGYIKVEYDGDSSEPYKVSRVLEILNATEQSKREDEMRSAQERENKVITLMCGSMLLLCVGGGTYLWCADARETKEKLERKAEEKELDSHK